MRRVVADQIKALNELTEIVTRSGRSLDLSEPVAEQRQQVALPERQWSAAQGTVTLGDVSRREPPRQEPRPALRIDAPRQEPLRQDVSRQDVLRQDVSRQDVSRQDLPRQDAPRQEISRQEISRQDPSRQEAARPTVRPEPTRVPPTARPAADRSQGWLSDLLARASRDETPEAVPSPPAPLPVPVRPSARGPEPLDAITLDIARMIDPAAASDAWDRYRRGDEDAFQRGIYTGRGSQTFEEIRRRYRSDGDFRATVDRYVQEFERLLTQIQDNDRDDQMTRTYLASDSGKVYTMLAHAAGRLA